MEWNSALEIPLAPAHVRTTQTTRGLDANALSSRLECSSDGSLQRTTERDASFELVGDAAGEQCGIEFGVVDFDDIEFDPATRDVLEA